MPLCVFSSDCEPPLGQPECSFETVLFRLLARRDPLTYVEVERKTTGRTAFRVSLGTMPDYGREVDGLAISGVSEGVGGDGGPGGARPAPPPPAPWGPAAPER